MGRHKKKLPKAKEIKKEISPEMQKTAIVMHNSSYDTKHKPSFALEYYMRSLK